MYLCNIYLTRAVLGKTPFEALTREKPVVGHFTVSGCLCYTHVTKDDREKCDTKANRCIMMGYCTETKAYQLYDIEKKKIIFSQDVVFDETKNAIKADDDPPKNESVVKIYCILC